MGVIGERIGPTGREPVGAPIAPQMQWGNGSGGGGGKRGVAIRAAQAGGADLFPADPTQVSRHMDIGTDKPGARDRGAVPHRLIDLVDPDEPFNAGQYRQAALQEIVRLHGDGRLPLVVGGTGLYIRTLAYGLWEGPPADWDLRRHWLAEEAAQGEG